MTAVRDETLIRTAPSTSALLPPVPESLLSSTARPDSKPSTSIQKTHVSLDGTNIQKLEIFIKTFLISEKSVESVVFMLHEII